jgi:hypothetical protein
MGFTARAALLAAIFGLVPAMAAAQAPGATTAEPAPTTPATTPAVPTAAPSTTDTPAPSASAAAPTIPATGYGWSTTPKKHVPQGHGPARRARVDTTADAVLPGFETLADGSSRLFVQLSKSAAYDTKTAAGTITYVLKGVHVDRRNNYNPLVTVHFNTPVTSARLVPHGQDLWFVVDLRASVQPTVTMDAAKDGAAMLRIEFPKGDYLPAAAATSGGTSFAATGAPAASTTPAPPGAAPAPHRPRRPRHQPPAGTDATPSSP